MKDINTRKKLLNSILSIGIPIISVIICAWAASAKHYFIGIAAIVGLLAASFFVYRKFNPKEPEDKNPAKQLGSKKTVYASLGKRFLAQVIDGGFYIFLMVGIGFFNKKFAAEYPILVLVNFGIFFGFVFFNESYLVFKKGHSIGKKIAGIRIVDENQNNIDLISAIKRAMVKNGLLLFLIFGAAFYAIPMFINKEKQSLGDFVAKSYVTKT